jgi:hypothetical protein
MDGHGNMLLYLAPLMISNSMEALCKKETFDARFCSGSRAGFMTTKSSWYASVWNRHSSAYL